METTGVLDEGDETPNIDRIKQSIQDSSFDDYIMTKSQMFSTYEQHNTPGNRINHKRSIPWNNSGLNPDIIVLAFWCMGYDLDKCHERVGGGGDKSKQCNTVYRFRKSEDYTRDPRTLGEQI